MKNIFFSIVIPTYNSQDTIVPCIESCIHQSYKNFEIIIVDDCSADETVNLTELYIKQNKLNNIQINKLAVNSGASVARNKGIDIANGKFIAFLDSDDYFHFMKLEILNQHLSKNLNIDLMGHNHYIENEADHSNIFLNTSEVKLEKVNCKSLLLRNFAVTPSVVFRKSILPRFNEQMRYTEDHDFFIRICLNNYLMYYLDLKLVGLGRRPLSIGGQSSNNFKMRLGEIKMYINLYKVDLKYILLIPFLVLFSILKHIIKIIK